MQHHIAVVKGNDRKKNIFDALGMIKNEIDNSIEKKAKNILFIKVNALDSTILGACTHPESLEAILDYFSGRFEHVIIGDNSSCFANGPNIYESLKSKFENLEFSNLKEFASKELEFEMLDGTVKAKIAVPDAYIISLALPKSHDNFVFTGCSKNMVGCVVENRTSVHALKAHERLFLNNMVKANKPAWKNLVRIIESVKPDFAVLDGFTGMEGDGPALGKVVKLGVVLAGLDCVALDILAGKICGFEKIPYLDECIAKGIGSSDADIIRKGFSEISEISRKFEQHPMMKYQTITELKSAFPKVNTSLVKAVMMHPHPHRMAAKVLKVLMNKK